MFLFFLLCMFRPIFCVFVCKFVLYYCLRVSTQLQLIIYQQPFFFFFVCFTIVLLIVLYFLSMYVLWYNTYLTAIGLTPGGSNAVHIYTQTAHRIQRAEHT
jgi:hypothetical protein